MRLVATCWGHSAAMGAVLGVRHHWGAASPCLPGARELPETGSAALRECPGPVGMSPRSSTADITGMCPGCPKCRPEGAPAPTAPGEGGHDPARGAPYSCGE